MALLAVEPRAAELLAGEPRAAELLAVEPRAAELLAAEPGVRPARLSFAALYSLAAAVRKNQC